MEGLNILERNEQLDNGQNIQSVAKRTKLIVLRQLPCSLMRKYHPTDSERSSTLVHRNTNDRSNQRACKELRHECSWRTSQVSTENYI